MTADTYFTYIQRVSGQKTMILLNLSIFLSKNNFKSLNFGVSSDFFTSCKGHSPGRPLWSYRISANSTGV